MSSKDKTFIHEIISSLLFVHGDSVKPFKECIDFIENFLFSQLKIILTSANENRISRNAPKLGIEDFIIQARKQPNLMKRFLLRIKRYDEALKAKNFYNTIRNVDSDCEDYSTYNTILSTEEDCENDSKNITVKLKNILTRIGDCEEYIDFINNNYQYEDKTKLKILQKKEERTKNMSTDEYILYENNRSKTLFSPTYMSRSRHKKILDRIDSQFNFSTFSVEAVQCLNFIVSEIISILVAQATEIRSHYVKPKDTSSIYESISLDFYKLALKKTQRFMKTGNYLFGVID
uniref:Transcription initiation factor TFIID subunit 8 n=1 Tax=Parastrongyloides trichosuri TaxID=131310 RepID=A0A0N4Z2E3_PARTI